MRIRSLLALIVAVPLFFVLVLGTVGIQGTIAERNVSNEAIGVLKDARIISDLVHELQKERGMSAGHIASKGRAFRDELAEQRELTNRELKTAADQIARLSQTNTNAKDVARRLLQIGEIRERIDFQEITVPKLAKFYTSSINDLIAVFETSLHNIEDPRIRSMTVPVISVVEAKEAAGLERAMGAAGFGRGAFAAATYTKFAAFAGKQNAYLNTALSAARGDLRAAIEGVRALDEWKNIDALRTLARQGLETSDLGGTTGPVWFQTSTQWVNALRTLEDTVSRDLEASAQQVVNDTTTAIIVYIIGAVAILAVSMMVPWLASRRFQTSISALLTSMKDIADNNVETQIPHLEHRGEIGEIARTVRVLKDNAVARIEAEKQSAEDREKREIAEAEAVERERAADEELRKAAEAEAEREQQREAERRDSEERERERLAEIERKEQEDRLVQERERARIVAQQREQEQRQSRALETVVDALSARLKGLSNGDLVSSVDTPFAQDYEQLRTDLNFACQTLCDVISKSTIHLDGVQDGARQISHSARDLAGRTEEQSTELVTTVTTLNEVVSGVRSSTEDASTAEKATQSAKETAEESGKIMGQAIRSMKEIEESSDQISEIIGVIDDIAFQTNLLALNAGVEAARAGEAGRGFAVVAAEVRALAQRCTDAAGEIKALITKSTDQVKKGAGQVTEAGEALEGITSAIVGINDLMSQLAETSKSQLSGLADISDAISNIDRTTQQNASMADESNAGAIVLATEVKELNQLMSRFVVTHDAIEDAA